MVTLKNLRQFDVAGRRYAFARNSHKRIFIQLIVYIFPIDFPKAKTAISSKSHVLYRLHDLRIAGISFSTCDRVSLKVFFICNPILVRSKSVSGQQWFCGFLGAKLGPNKVPRLDA